VKNYRPQILLLSGNPTARPAILQLATQITKNLSLLVCGKINQVPNYTLLYFWVCKICFAVGNDVRAAQQVPRRRKPFHPRAQTEGVFQFGGRAEFRARCPRPFTGHRHWKVATQRAADGI